MVAALGIDNSMDPGYMQNVRLHSKECGHISSQAVGNGAGKNSRINTKLKVTCQWALKGIEAED